MSAESEWAVVAKRNPDFVLSDAAFPPPSAVRKPQDKSPAARKLQGEPSAWSQPPPQRSQPDQPSKASPNRAVATNAWGLPAVQPAAAAGGDDGSGKKKRKRRPRRRNKTSGGGGGGSSGSGVAEARRRPAPGPGQISLMDFKITKRVGQRVRKQMGIRQKLAESKRKARQARSAAAAPTSFTAKSQTRGKVRRRKKRLSTLKKVVNSERARLLEALRAAAAENGPDADPDVGPDEKADAVDSDPDAGLEWVKPLLEIEAFAQLLAELEGSSSGSDAGSDAGSNAGSDPDSGDETGLANELEDAIATELETGLEAAQVARMADGASSELAEELEEAARAESEALRMFLARLLPRALQLAHVAVAKSPALAQVLPDNHREYVDQLVPPELNRLIPPMLKELSRLQERARVLNPTKAKRRLVTGLREVVKFVKVGTAKAVIVAPDIEKVEADGGLDDKIAFIRTRAAELGIPLVYALSRNRLGRAMGRKLKISVAAILFYDGVNTEFNRMVELADEGRAAFDAALAAAES
ncbi:uncharacterized protein AMSG_05138 [Thecamonas trahens ATCC 50062]|uniref:Ribosomal protein eL8/eL30/eS12/Gadd45 domain-containing protein n=1 Tax=Thecamonas trahens ATCC 50062 TaxID=461836 RepID=A0A0L0DAA4_THETB|nr:hypothetical protein AMSG_05138 [Thecamonas trahens ATCC 50062]KNC49160.1 hypothetical protein AMSG_05138 [Thecamonas trahens ATCC 50062]|eukprot:XP_013758181.1 hypothetical protein AMSG_05138 [Thecamonas trahens ATCC 50062]